MRFILLDLTQLKSLIRRKPIFDLSGKNRLFLAAIDKNPTFASNKPIQI